MKPIQRLLPRMRSMSVGGEVVTGKGV